MFVQRTTYCTFCFYEYLPYHLALWPKITFLDVVLAFFFVASILPSTSPFSHGVYCWNNIILFSPRYLVFITTLVLKCFVESLPVATHAVHHFSILLKAFRPIGHLGRVILIALSFRSNGSQYFSRPIGPWQTLLFGGTPITQEKLHRTKQLNATKNLSKTHTALRNSRNYTQNTHLTTRMLFTNLW